MAASPAGPEPDDGSGPPGEELTGKPPGRGTAVPEALAAGFTHRDPGHHGTGFAAGGAADVMAPGPALAGLTAQASADGLGHLDDDEIAGLLCASRRLASWAAAGEVAAITELARRRTAEGPRAIEHLDDEIAALLILTGRSAARLTGIAASLARLPQTTVALRTGQLDWPRASLIADETCCLSDQDAAAAEDQVLPLAPGQTTGQLRAAVRRAILAIDAAAAIKRRKKAEKDARVETWTEAAGTSALAGRDLPPAHVLAADRHIDKLARWLKGQGAQGNLDQLRAKVYIALLTGQRPGTLLPPAADSAGRSGANPDWPTGLHGSVNLTMPLTTWLGLTTHPGEAAGLGALDAGVCRDLAAALAANPASRWCLTLTSPDGQATAHGCAKTGPGTFYNRPPGATPPDVGPPGAQPSSVQPSSTGPPHNDVLAWLSDITLIGLEAGTCAHPRETPSYRPCPALRHLINIRDRTCFYPTCRQQAVHCDLDHTIPYEQGGRTCECNLGPGCRRHHRAKQAPGWHLEQTRPGIFTWTLPSGRQFTTAPGRYPA